jgi:integrase
MGWCKEREYIRDNPVFKMRLRGSVPRVTSLTPDQIKAVLAAARGHQVTFLLTALTTGMRHREILGLRWKDILLDSNLITLSGERTKSHRNRQIPIPDVLARHLALIHAEAVQTIVRAGQEPATALPAAPVVMYEGRQIKSFKTSWALICRKLCLKGIRIHDLRHTYATTLRSSGVTLLDIKELLGHQDLQTTQRYAHFDGAIRSNLSVFDKILGDGVPA